MATVPVDIALLHEILEEVRYLRAEVRALHEKANDGLLSCTKAAEKWGVSRRTVTRWIASGKVKPVNSEGHPRFHPEEIQRVMRELP